MLGLLPPSLPCSSLWLHQLLPAPSAPTPLPPPCLQLPGPLTGCRNSGCHAPRCFPEVLSPLFRRRHPLPLEEIPKLLDDVAQMAYLSQAGTQALVEQGRCFPKLPLTLSRPASCPPGSCLLAPNVCARQRLVLSFQVRLTTGCKAPPSASPQCLWVHAQLEFRGCPPCWAHILIWPEAGRPIPDTFPGCPHHCPAVTFEYSPSPPYTLQCDLSPELQCLGHPAGLTQSLPLLDFSLHMGTCEGS